ncbi:MAG: vWA domain-containing protein, partial [Planctomycetota bacterium]
MATAVSNRSRRPARHFCGGLVLPGVRLALALLAAQALAFDLAPAAAAEEPPVDVVFLLDSSASIFRNDPLKAREFVMEALAGSWRPSPGDRVGIGRFSGWNETERTKEIVLPLTEIPKGVEARRALVAKMRSALAAATSTGTASDVNAALEFVLAEAVGGPAPAAGRKLWAVVITDGDMNVIEGETVRQDYIDAAKELYNRVDPETLGSAATEMLFSKTLPALKKRGVGVSFLGIGCDARNPGRLFERGRTDVSGGAFCADGPLLREAVAGLLEGNPVRRKEGVLSHGLAESTVPAGSELDVPLKVLPGTLRTQVVVFASSGEFDVALLDAGGAAPQGVRFKLLGEGRPYRVGWIDGAAPGEYKLRFTSRAESALKAEVTVSCRAAVKLRIDWPDDLDPHLMGLPVLAKASVLDEDGKVVSDPGLLKEARVSFALADEAGKTASGAAAFTGAEGAVKAGVRFSIPTEGLGPGKCTATARLEVFPRDPGSEDGPYLYRGPVASSEVRLLPGVLVEFGKKEVLVGQEVPVRATSTSALDAPPPEIIVTASTLAMEPDGEPVTLKLSGTGAGKAEYAGVTSFEKPEEWKILPGGSEEFLVRPGEASRVDVRALALRILSAEPPHEELESLEFRVPYCETSAPESEGNRLPVLLDLGTSGAAAREIAAAADAVPTLAVGFEPSESLVELRKSLGDSGAEPARSPIAFEISTQGEKDAKGRLKAAISLKVGTKDALPLSPGFVGPKSLVSSEFYKSMWPVPSCEPGSLDVEATVGELKLNRQRPVKITFPDFWEKA